MGRGPIYIALTIFFSRDTRLGKAFIMALCVICFQNLLAQEGTTAIDTTANYGVDPASNGLVKKAPTQSLESMDTTTTDSAKASAAKKLPLHSARKAAYLSAVLPGLGQAYNKKYWKIPIIYAGLAGCAYALYYTAYNFNGFKAVDRAQKALVPNPNASFNGISDPAEVQTYQAYYKKYLDISAIGFGVFYLLNVIDATVDAHLMGWNMKDDLSVSWSPMLINSPNYNSAAAGLSFTLHF